MLKSGFPLLKTGQWDSLLLSLQDKKKSPGCMMMPHFENHCNKVLLWSSSHFPVKGESLNSYAVDHCCFFFLLVKDLLGDFLSFSVPNSPFFVQDTCSKPPISIVRHIKMVTELLNEFNALITRGRTVPAECCTCHLSCTREILVAVCLISTNLQEGTNSSQKTRSFYGSHSPSERFPVHRSSGQLAAWDQHAWEHCG